jgi:3'-phosphoadenosine 5'-phosphosulfate sulfotransferase (PAPS reductase)/FAD synthetase
MTDVKDRIGDRLVILSVSGGKDSAAASLHLTELGIEHWRVFADTGWEDRRVYEHVRGPLTDQLGPIFEVRGRRQMRELVLHKAMFPSRTIRFCTQELKVKPLAEFVEFCKEVTGRDVVNVVGIRASESESRSKMPEWEYDSTFDCDVWRPLLRWTEQDVIDIHRRHGLPPNPLYLAGAERVGCWPCIFARKSEIKMIADTDPARIDMIRELEREVNDAARARYAERGQELEHVRSWFQVTHRSQVAGGYIPIDDVVRWARTGKGGRTEDRQLELFGGHDGCARWGLCDQAGNAR